MIRKNQKKMLRMIRKVMLKRKLRVKKRRKTLRLMTKRKMLKLIKKRMLKLTLKKKRLLQPRPTLLPQPKPMPPLKKEKLLQLKLLLFNLKNHASQLSTYPKSKWKSNWTNSPDLLTERDTTTLE